MLVYVPAGACARVSQTTEATSAPRAPLAERPSHAATLHKAPVCAHEGSAVHAPVPLQRFLDTAMPFAEGYMLLATVGPLSCIEELLGQSLVALQRYHRASGVVGAGMRLRASGKRGGAVGEQSGAGLCQQE